MNRYQTASESTQKKYQKSKYVRILESFDEGSTGMKFREGECLLCGGIFKLAGMGGHLHYKHGVSR